MFLFMLVTDKYSLQRLNKEESFVKALNNGMCKGKLKELLFKLKINEKLKSSLSIKPII